MPWNHDLAEVAFADEEWRKKEARQAEVRQNLVEVRFLVPKSFTHLGEAVLAAQFGRMLINWNARLGSEARAMPERHRRGIGKFVRVHGQWLTYLLVGRKRPTC